MPHFVVWRCPRPSEANSSPLLDCLSSGRANTHLATDRVPAHRSQSRARPPSPASRRERLSHLRAFLLLPGLPPEARRNTGIMVPTRERVGIPPPSVLHPSQPPF